jgi:tetratricopeptide (TPR) repeat protein
MKSVVNKVQQRDKRANRLMIAMAGALLLAGCNSSNQKVANSVAEATALLEAGNLDVARIIALRAVRERDDVASAWMLLGRVNLMSGRIGEAYNAYSRALELDATNIEALQITSEIALQAGRTRDAVRAADQLLTLQPTLTRPKLIKGFVALKENRTDDANKLADEILIANPGDEIGMALKARVLGRLGDIAGAAKTLETAAETSENDILLSTLAEVYRKANDGAKLEATLARLVDKAPGADRVFDLAAVRYKLGKVETARNGLFKYLGDHQRDMALQKRATNFLIDNDPQIFPPDRVAQIATSGDMIMIKIATQVLLSQGRADDASRIVSAAYGNRADNDIKALYATAQARMGNRAEADPIIESILEKDEANALALLQRARGHLAREQQGAALNDAQLVLRDDPQSVEARLLIASAYRSRGDNAAARRFFEQSVQDLPQSIRIARGYVAFLTQTNDRARARKIAEAYVGLNPAILPGWRLLQSQCADPACAAGAAKGLSDAMTLFAAQDASPLSGSGLFGRM